MNKSELLQYASYALWISLIVVFILIINRKAKQRAAAKKALLHPMINLFTYELPQASGTINFFFDADEAIDYRFFITQTNTGATTTLAQGTCKKGGQKILFDTTSFDNGIYFYGIETAFQRVEKRLIVAN